MFSSVDVLDESAGIGVSVDEVGHASTRLNVESAIRILDADSTVAGLKLRRRASIQRQRLDLVIRKDYELAIDDLDVGHGHVIREHLDLFDDDGFGTGHVDDLDHVNHITWLIHGDRSLTRAQPE